MKQNKAYATLPWTIYHRVNGRQVFTDDAKDCVVMGLYQSGQSAMLAHLAPRLVTDPDYYRGPIIGRWRRRSIQKAVQEVLRRFQQFDPEPVLSQYLQQQMRQGDSNAKNSFRLLLTAGRPHVEQSQAVFQRLKDWAARSALPVSLLWGQPADGITRACYLAEEDAWFIHASDGVGDILNEERLKQYFCEIQIDAGDQLVFNPRVRVQPNGYIRIEERAHSTWLDRLRDFLRV